MSDTRFANLVYQGKMSQALRRLSEESGGGLLNPKDIDSVSGETVRTVLEKKHPAPVEPTDHVRLGDEPQ